MDWKKIGNIFSSRSSRCGELSRQMLPRSKQRINSSRFLSSRRFLRNLKSPIIRAKQCLASEHTTNNKKQAATKLNSLPGASGEYLVS